MTDHEADSAGPAIAYLVGGLLAAAAILLATGCRTAGTADQTAKLTLKQVKVSGNLYIAIGGEREQETHQSAGKDVGVTGLAAQASDNAVGVGGSAPSRSGTGGTTTLDTTGKPWTPTK